MADDTQAVDSQTEETTDAQAADGQEQPASQQLDTVDKLPDWAQTLIKELRTESAKHRKAKSDAEKAAEEQARKQAEEQGEFKRLYEETQARLTEAEQRAQAAELARIRSQVAAKHNLPAELADRLRGETEEELEADAEALLSVIPKPQPATATDGASGAGTRQPPTPAKSDREIKEEAAVLGVSEQNLKEYYERLARQ